jgi:hypothetical protein
MKLKRMLAAAMALVLAFALSVSAFATEEAPEISVELNGQKLTFNEFAPELNAESGRTFLPFRQVFEALGCASDDIVWDKETQTATAVRGDTTIVLTLGSPEAKVTVGDVEQTVTMDVAPYMNTDENGGGYIYVPVRFAAQALGCNVGWDAATRTAVIVDVEKLMDETLGDNEFTILEKYLTYAQKFQEGNWAVSGTMTLNILAMGGEVITMDADMSGITADSTQVQMNMTMDMDMSGLIALIETLAGEAAPTDTPTTMKLDMEIRADLSTGMLYMNLGDELNAMMNAPAGAWISMDMNALYSEMGIDLETLMAATKITDMKSALEMVMSYMPVDQAESSYALLKAAAEGIVASLSDSAFKKTSAGYTTTINVGEGEDTFTINVGEGEDTFAIDFVIATNAAGNVRGYTMKVDCAVDLSSVEGMDELAAQLGIAIDSLTIKAEAGLDANNQETMTMTFAMGELFSMTLDAANTYKTTTEEPVTAVPADVTVVDYFDLIAGMAGAEEPIPEAAA